MHGLALPLGRHGSSLDISGESYDGRVGELPWQ